MANKVTTDHSQIKQRELSDEFHMMIGYCITA